jgi:broad specificity phosphatase PhoE
MEELPFTRLLLVRHGQAESGPSDGDPGLTERGRLQAAALARGVGVGPDDVLLASPLRRAQETAALLGRRFASDDDLREFEFGPELRLMTAEVVAERLDLMLWRPEHGFPGGETLRGFQARCAAALERLGREHVGRRVVAVTHSGVLDAAIRWAYGATPESDWTTESTVPNASVTELLHWPDGRFAGGAPRFTHLHRVGDVSHLPEELRTEI